MPDASGTRAPPSHVTSPRETNLKRHTACTVRTEAVDSASKAHSTCLASTTAHHYKTGKDSAELTYPLRFESESEERIDCRIQTTTVDERTCSTIGTLNSL
jgi:hypothetical protein